MRPFLFLSFPSIPSEFFFFCMARGNSEIKFLIFIIAVQGELALAFGDLLRKLWSSGRTPVAPRAFKGKLARFAPQFSGYNQHDSQVSTAFCPLCAYLFCHFTSLSF